MVALCLFGRYPAWIQIQNFFSACFDLSKREKMTADDVMNHTWGMVIVFDKYSPFLQDATVVLYEPTAVEQFRRDLTFNQVEKPIDIPYPVGLLLKLMGIPEAALIFGTQEDRRCSTSSFGLCHFEVLSFLQITLQDGCWFNEHDISLVSTSMHDCCICFRN